MIRRVIVGCIVAGVVLLGGATTASAGNNKGDADNNGISDAGVLVSGHYTEIYVDGDTGCEARVNYRGDFGNTPYLDSGWIQNHWVCKGPDGTSTFNYLFVHETDPRYTGNPDWSIWGTWEWKVLTESGYGNWVKRPVS